MLVTSEQSWYVAHPYSVKRGEIMAISKIILNGVTQMDLTGDTVSDASHIRSGYTGHKNDGTQVTGAYSGGDSSIKRKTGSFTPSQTYSSSTNVELTTISNIGFTPTRFYLWVDKVSDLSQTRYAVSRTSYESFGSTPEHVRVTTRYTNTTGTLGSANTSSSWTTQSGGYLYNDGASVYFRASGSYILLANVKYNWIAEA